MKLYSINAGMFKLDGGAMFGVVPKSMWNKLNPADENNMNIWAMRCLLIEDEGRLILVDTGMGDKQDPKFFSHFYFNEGNNELIKGLQQHGFSTDDVTDVVHTHLHFDHCGGTIVKENNELVPLCKNATMWCNSIHWQWATVPNEREKASFLKENILPMQTSDRLQFIPVNDVENITKMQEVPSGIISNLSFIISNGHTKGMMLPKINYNGKTVVFATDLLPSIHHIPMPYIMAYDMYPVTTLTEKKLFLQEAEANNYTLILQHDPMNECCNLQKTERGIRAKDTFSLSEL